MFNQAKLIKFSIYFFLLLGFYADVCLAATNPTLDSLIAKTTAGQTNNTVKQLQTQLKQLGFFPKNTTANGYYGPATATAVKQYQAGRKKVTVSVKKPVATGTTSTALTIDQLIARTKAGQTSADVKLLQSKLQQAGYLATTTTLTGYYGPATVAAIAGYQTKNKNIGTSSTVKVATASGAANQPTSGAHPLPAGGTGFLALTGGQATTYFVKFTNKTKVTWLKNQTFLETGPFLRTPSQFKAANWLTYYRPITLVNDVAPGQSVVVDFELQAPLTLSGTVQENFQLVVNNFPLANTQFRMFIDVTPPPPVPVVATNPININLNQNSTTTAVGNSSGTPWTVSTNIMFNQEPLIRVGLYVPPANSVVTVSSDSVFNVYAGSSLVLANIQPNNNLYFSFNAGLNRFKLSQTSAMAASDVPTSDVAAVNTTSATTSDGSAIGTTTTTTVAALAPTAQGLKIVDGQVFYGQVLRLVPVATSSIMTINSWNNSAQGSGRSGDNRFRNVLEFHYSQSHQQLWAINELPLDSYVKGLGETSNYSPVEFQKVMAVAARTYALYHYLRGVNNGLGTLASTKHAADNFTVDSRNDQVYRGYNSEVRIPGLSQGVDATRGVVVTYNNLPVVTPYFSASDGRTRNYEDVWGGSPDAFPWCRGVPVPEEVGNKLNGHGVGMSAQGGLKMIVYSNKTWQDVLHHFYTGIALTQVYN